MSDEHTQGIKKSIEEIIGSDTVLKRKKKTEEDIQRETFEKIILLMEQIQTRGILMHAEFGLDYSGYDEKFYEIIDRLFAMHYGREATEIIFFYIYERLNPDGTINSLYDQNGQEVVLQNSNDLWHLVNHIKDKTKKVKQK